MTDKETELVIQMLYNQALQIRILYEALLKHGHLKKGDLNNLEYQTPGIRKEVLAEVRQTYYQKRQELGLGGPPQTS